MNKLHKDPKPMWGVISLGQILSNAASQKSSSASSLYVLPMGVQVFLVSSSFYCHWHLITQNTCIMFSWPDSVLVPLGISEDTFMTFLYSRKKKN